MFIVMLEIRNASDVYYGLVKNLNEAQLKRYQILFKEEMILGENALIYKSCYQDLTQSYYLPPGKEIVDLTGALYVPLDLAA